VTDAIDGLRRATRDIHDRLHLHPAFAPLMGTRPDAAGYRRLIGQLYGFHAPAEAWLFDAAEDLLPELHDLPQRRKAHLLRDDLDAIGRVLPGVEPPPERMRLTRPLSRPAVLGGLYVTEGATLGGRELGRLLAPVLRDLGLAEPDGRRFFLAYGTAQGTMWRGFCTVLETAAAGFDPAERQAMEAAARDLFLAMEDWLTSSRVPA